MIKHSGKLFDRRVLCFGVALFLFTHSMLWSVNGSLNQVKNEDLANVLPLPGQSQPVEPPEAVVNDFYKSYLHMEFWPF